MSTLRKLLNANEGVDNSCKKKSYPSKKEARNAIPILQTKGHHVRSVHFCLEHNAWHVASQNP